MLNNFFKINLPYGIVKNDKNEWTAFNREYQPLGISKSTFRDLNSEIIDKLPIYTQYKGITEKLLTEIGLDETGIQRNEQGDIYRVYFYNDATCPTNQKPQNQSVWNDYFERIRKLSKLEVK